MVLKKDDGSFITGSGFLGDFRHRQLISTVPWKVSMSGKKRRSSPGRAGDGAPAPASGLSPLAADVFTYAGDRMTTVLAEGAQHALLTGHAEVATTDMRIDADQIELFGKDFIYAQCRGDVKVVDAKRGLDLSSTQLFYDRQQKIARIQGNAMMEDLKNQMVVKGGFIEDRDKEQLTIIQIGVRILKKESGVPGGIRQVLPRKEDPRASGNALGQPQGGHLPGGPNHGEPGHRRDHAG